MLSRFPLVGAPVTGLICLAGLAAMAGCSSEARSAGAFCSRLAEAAPTLVTPIASAADVDAVVSAHRDLRDHAPLAIEPEWSQLVTALETADTVDPADAASLQRAADAAYASEEAAHGVAEWARTTCGVEIGPVGTVAPPPTPTTTTAAAGEG